MSFQESCEHIFNHDASLSLIQTGLFAFSPCVCLHSSRMRAAGWAASLPFAPLVLAVAARRLGDWAADVL